MNWGILIDAVNDATIVLIGGICLAAPICLLVRGALLSLAPD